MNDGGARKLKVFVSDWKPLPVALGTEASICAIGDVHGQHDHLSTMIDWLSVNVFTRHAASQHLVLLGDYIDRGPESINVLAYLGELDLPSVNIIKLRGNHDIYLQRFLNDPDCDFDWIEHWMADGGNRTLFGLGIHNEDFFRDEIRVIRERALRNLPQAAVRCLDELRLSVRLGNYLFVHAGVHPDQPLDLDHAETLTWVREPFLSGKNWQHDFVVVHGHTVCGPDVRPHRIACDSGAFYTGVLTCAQIEDAGVRFIAVTAAPDLSDLDQIRKRPRQVNVTWVRVQ